MAAPRILVVPGGTSAGAVALANASIHKLVELYEERAADPNHPAPHTVVVLREPESVSPATLRGSAATPQEAFPEERYPGLAREIDQDPAFFDGIDLVVPTSGSSAGAPRLVGLSTEALIASAKATELALNGPGRWILALPTHHIAGAMVLLRAAVAETNPQIVDTSEGFSPEALLPAVRGATQDDMPGYLSLVPTQLSQCLDAEQVVEALRSLSAILVGGAATNQQLLARAREAGLRVRTTYGMTETAGGCVYDGLPLPGTSVRAVDWDGRTRLAINGPTLMTRYLDADSPFFEEGGHRWLLTGDLGIIRASGTVEVRGRADDVIVSGGLSIAPGLVRHAVRSHEGISDAWIMATPDAKWGHVVTALVIPERMPSDSLEMAKLGSSVREHAAAHIGRAQAPRRVVAIDSLPYLGYDKIDRAAAADAATRAAGTAREWVR
ncbi:AMP-binding protein [Schaalia meyeri]|uniref:AMP-binding protein n=1 Tax=Schaalia meyeri TaxID=52773 RepID=A0AAQ0BWF6_9ACTO|nr:AMP-binding protein [Schaalia meyeri]OFQ23861.1 acyl-CoA synthetase [Actinomyces sp. HMSC062G12]QQC43901.1 AMP-binding protein [Schaalia meyeri]SDR76883.1 O-succinylbenzoic acid--CoA ligase [Schaalia meyeri]